MHKMSVEIQWDDLEFAPYNKQKKGGVYAAYTLAQKDGAKGYLGVQITGTDERKKFLFSIWDGDRWEIHKGHKRPKPSSKLVWPMNMKICHRNCQDCALPDLRPWKKKGLTTGTQCYAKYPAMKKGDRFGITLEQTEKRLTINTKKFGGMPKGHAQFGEKDRNITGSVWSVNVEIVKTKEKIEVGKIMFEGDGRGMNHMGTFDEMIGCNGCNMIQHKDTRYGPIIYDDDGGTRTPIKMEGLTKQKNTICKRYHISGSKSHRSISFEGGPLTSKSFHKDDKYHKIW